MDDALEYVEKIRAERMNKDILLPDGVRVRDITAAMLKDGVDMKLVARYSGLSIDEIEGLRV